MSVRDAVSPFTIGEPAAVKPGEGRIGLRQIERCDGREGGEIEPHHLAMRPGAVVV